MVLLAQIPLIANGSSSAPRNDGYGCYVIIDQVDSFWLYVGIVLAGLYFVHFDSIVSSGSGWDREATRYWAFADFTWSWGLGLAENADIASADVAGAGQCCSVSWSLVGLDGELLAGWRRRKNESFDREVIGVFIDSGCCCSFGWS